MALARLGLNCLKSSSRVRYGTFVVSSVLYFNFAELTNYDQYTSRILEPRSSSFPTRSFSIWPKNASAPAASIAKDEQPPQLSTSLPEGVDPYPTIDLAPEPVSASASDALTSASDSLTTASPAASESFSSAISALQYGDLSSLGLISYTPVGLIRSSFELINVSLSLPWLQTLILGTLLWRLFLLPFTIKSLHFSSRMALIQPQSKQIMSQMSSAQKNGDLVQMKKLQNDLSGLYKTVGIKSPLQGLVGPLVQLPVAIGMFLAVKGLCEYPLPQMTIPQFSVGAAAESLSSSSSILAQYLPDLTVADPTGILAPAFAITMFWQMTVTARDMDMSSQPAMAHVMNLMRFPGAPVFAIFMSTLPSGLVVSIITASLATGVQSLVLRIPAVRRYFGILPLPTTTGTETGAGAVDNQRKGLPSFMETFRWIKGWWKRQLEDAKRKAMEVEEQRKRSDSGRRRL
ncbi:hypothetical protein D9757_008154 [Collybiopsis confluens]|uniref:Membrane insertase YidC/Oxa/ALB C-terminal domain-containing protein n=1 Tax=Collybiopsis confluens TaxID=2823264 RepID=A0A8H5HE02_9AGAR|nr:hypothetical protein D9757_008154 [Collybiopsis confluens]